MFIIKKTHNEQEMTRSAFFVGGILKMYSLFIGFENYLYISYIIHIIPHLWLRLNNEVELWAFYRQMNSVKGDGVGSREKRPGAAISCFISRVFVWCCHTEHYLLTLKANQTMNATHHVNVNRWLQRQRLLLLL